MATIELTLQAATALYDVAKKVQCGELDAGPLNEAYLELAAQLDSVCSEAKEWTQGASNNLIISGLGWMVSYKVASDSGEPETALIDRNAGEYYMLAGDHREAYAQAAEHGWAALKLVYETLKDQFPHDNY